MTFIGKVFLMQVMHWLFSFQNVSSKSNVGQIVGRLFSREKIYSSDSRVEFTQQESADSKYVLFHRICSLLKEFV